MPYISRSSPCFPIFVTVFFLQAVVLFSKVVEPVCSATSRDYCSSVDKDLLVKRLETALSEVKLRTDEAEEAIRALQATIDRAHALLDAVPGSSEAYRKHKTALVPQTRDYFDGYQLDFPSKSPYKVANLQQGFLSLQTIALLLVF